MAVADRILKNFNLFVDGQGYAGQAENFEAPSLTLMGEDFRAGGMDAPVFVEMGQEKLTAGFNLCGYDNAILSLWGVGPQAQVQFVGRGALEDLNGTVTAVNITMNGHIKTIKPDQWESGKKAGLKFELELVSYTYTSGGAVLHDIDVVNFKRVINGVDRLAAQRKALGL